MYLLWMEKQDFYWILKFLIIFIATILSRLIIIILLNVSTLFILNFAVQFW